ncbi:hypothetical protein [Falsiroseomonas sp. HW251]|uniref:hypothetical protein n=1 Tax=Falsiroseomonas sp. HW251 TaxID=3390998 RepID=UPI003D31B912
MPLPGDDLPGEDDSFVFGPGAPAEPEDAPQDADLWSSLMARWIALIGPEEDRAAPPADDLWVG